MVRVPTRSLALDPAECKNTVGQPGGRTTRPGPLEGTGPRCCSRGSGAANRVGLRTLLALDDLEADPLALVEALVAVHLDGRVVDEDVLAAVDGDEAEALLGVEPLHGALCHVRSHVSCMRTASHRPGKPGRALPPANHERGTEPRQNVPHKTRGESRLTHT